MTPLVFDLCTLAATYSRVVATLEDLLAGLAPDEQTAILGGTAFTTYGIHEVDGPVLAT